MASGLEEEGQEEGSATSVRPEIEKLLIEHRISAINATQYTEVFKALGVEATEDLKDISNDDDFKALLDAFTNHCKSKNVSVTFMERLRLEKAWKSLVPKEVNASGYKTNVSCTWSILF